jgi:hypothetical protein
LKEKTLGQPVNANLTAQNLNQNAVLQTNLLILLCNENLIVIKDK